MCAPCVRAELPQAMQPCVCITCGFLLPLSFNLKYDAPSIAALCVHQMPVRIAAVCVSRADACSYRRSCCAAMPMASARARLAVASAIDGLASPMPEGLPNCTAENNRGTRQAGSGASIMYDTCSTYCQAREFAWLPRCGIHIYIYLSECTLASRPAHTHNTSNRHQTRGSAHLLQY